MPSAALVTWASASQAPWACSTSALHDWALQACLSALEILLSPPFTSIEVASFMRFTVTGSVSGMPPPKGLFANLRLLPAGAGAGDQAKALPRALWPPPSRRSRAEAKTFGPIDRAPGPAPEAGAKCHTGHQHGSAY